jgi:decaprenyl-phosphate phosphoribosyltransferase
LPLLASGTMFEGNNFMHAFIGAVVFSLVASVVYIVNDIQDVEKDRLHPKKKSRPIASGAVSVRQASIFAVVLAVVAVALGFAIDTSWQGWVILTSYVAINVAYSKGLKNVPVVDITILAIGFVLRVLYGGQIVDIEVSRWLYLTVLAGAFYMGLGKRRGELLNVGTQSRKVNELYSHNFLDKNMYVCLGLTLVFYSLWATDPTKHSASLFWTIPMVMVLMMLYSLDVEKDGTMGDPVDVLTNNKVLGISAVAYVIITTFLLYI